MASFSSTLPPNSEEEDQKIIEQKNDDADQLVITQETLDHVSTLPKAKGWYNELYQYRGFWVPAPVLQGILIANNQQYDELDRTSSVLLTSYPKSGTTWLQALLFAIKTRAQYQDFSTHPLLTSNPHDCVPGIEHCAVMNPSNPVPKHPAAVVSSHLPFSLLPESIKCSGCSIVYVYRNPKDVLISFWKFVNEMRLKDSRPPLSLEEAVDSFCLEMAPYGPYWNHLLGYWEASLKTPQRIMFISYEELKSKTVECVKRLARFVGHPFSLEEEKDGVSESIVDLCSFQNLSRLEVNTSEVVADFELPTLNITNNMYFRKGEVQDYRNHLTTEMIERIDEITKNKWKDIGLRIPA